MGYIIDSNTIIDYLASRFTGNKLDQINIIFNNGFYVSVITKIEVLGFSSGSEDLDVNALNFMDLAEVYELSPQVVEQTIKIRKARKIKIADAIIAATAIVYKCTLISRNLSDFKSIDGLKVFDPYATELF